MAEIIPFPGTELQDEVDVASLKGGALFRHVDSVLSNPENYSFEAWKNQILQFLELKSEQIEDHIFNLGVNVFAHPRITPEFTRDMMLYMARSSNYGIRERLLKHLSQGKFNIPPTYLDQVKEALEEYADSEVSDATQAFHDRMMSATEDSTSLAIANDRFDQARGWQNVVSEKLAA